MNRYKILLLTLVLTATFIALLIGMLTAVAAPTAFALENAFPSLTFSAPTGITHAHDNRLFIAQQRGVISVVNLGGTSASVFLDIEDQVLNSGEQGLLGLVFHPNYPDTPYFYVNYIAKTSGDTHISRFTVSADPNVADPNSELILLTVNQPYANHNGGDLSFGPDGYLYIALGDGGSANDPLNSGQRLDTLLGKLLRIDVNGEGLPSDCDPAGNYTVPASNPFVGQAGACDEIWAYGLRNPWRFSFDRATGDLFIADVGQGAREEVNFQPAGSGGGENYGWCYFEGTLVNNSPTCRASQPTNQTPPIHEYTHADGCSITGGYMHRGLQYPSLNGTYFFGDFCSRKIWGLTQNGGGWSSTLLHTAGGNVRTFGEDACGNVYVSAGNSIYRLVDNAAAAAPNLCLHKSGPRLADFAEPITYTLRLNNTGSAAATQVNVTDLLPEHAYYVSGGALDGDVVSWTLPVVVALETAVLQFVITATQNITNEVYAFTADGGYAGVGRHPVPTQVRIPELVVSKTAPLIVEPGEVFTYTITVHNTGPMPVSGLVITDTLPVGATYISGGVLADGVVTWTADALAAGESLAVQFAVTVEETAVNSDYGVRIAAGLSFRGTGPVITFINPEQMFLPLIFGP